MNEYRARYLRGDCPCCGLNLCDWEWLGMVYSPQPIGEGVLMCGRCIGNEHNLTPHVVECILNQIVS